MLAGEKKTIYLLEFSEIIFMRLLIKLERKEFFYQKKYQALTGRDGKKIIVKNKQIQLNQIKLFFEVREQQFRNKCLFFIHDKNKVKHQLKELKTQQKNRKKEILISLFFMFSDKRYNIKEERYSMDFEPSDIDSYVSRPEERPEKPLFGWEYSISNSWGVIEEWKGLLELNGMEYLKEEAHVMQHEYLSIKSAYQIRMLAFCHQLQAQFHELTQNYHQAYLKLQLVKIQQLDAKLATLLTYMRDFDANTCDGHFDIFGPWKNKMYHQIKKCPLYCLDISIIDDLLSLIDVKKFKSCYEASLGANQLYYDKQIRKIIRKNPEYSHLFQIKKDYEELIKAVQELLLKDSLSESKKRKYIQVIKGQFYSHFLESSPANEFFRLSIHSKYCFAKSEAWDQDYYEDLCLEMLKMGFSNSKYTIFLKRINSESVTFLRRRHMKQFLIHYNKIITSILSLQEKIISEEMNTQCLEILLAEFSMPLIKAITIFYEENRKAYSIKDHQLHEIFIKTLEKIKILYLSFTKDTWILPTFIFNQISNSFFIENFDTLSKEIQKALPEMVNRLYEDKLPQRVTIKNGQVKLQKVERLQYIFAINFYIKDCVSDNIDELDLPEIKPYDFETTALYLSILRIKFRYSSPNGQQKNNYIKILDECIPKYKVQSSFSWYQHHLKLQQKEEEFNIMKSIKHQWARDVAQELLNLRDQRKNEKFIELFNNNELSLEQVVDLLKYSIGININPFSYYFAEEKIFSLMQTMKINLSLCFTNLFNLCLEEELMINQIHLCLLFYNTKVKDAEGSEIYKEIVLKIVVPWMEANDERVQEFKKRYPRFFQMYVVKEHIDIVGKALIKYMKENEAQPKSINNILNKIQYLQGLIEGCQVKEEVGQKFIANLLDSYHFEMNMKVIVSIIITYLKVIQKCKQIATKIQLDSFIPIKLVLDSQKLSSFLSRVSQLQNKHKEPIIRTILELLPKLYNQFHESVSIQNLCSILKLSNNCVSFESVYSSIKTISQWNDPYIGFIQGIVILCYCIDKPDERAECVKLWMVLEEKAENIKVESKNSLVQLLGKEIVEKIGVEMKRANAEKEDKDKYVEVRILQSIIWKIKCSIDDILEFTDLTNLLAQPKPRQKQFLVQWILAKEYKSQKHQILHKGISKLPILRECCEEVAQQFLNGQSTIYPEHIYKLIFINNKYSSEKIERLILSNIEKFDEVIGMKIHQKYIVRQIKKGLSELSSDFLEKALCQNPEPQIEKSSLLFKKLLCLPISDFKILNMQPIEPIKQVSEQQIKSEENIVENIQVGMQSKPSLSIQQKSQEQKTDSRQVAIQTDYFEKKEQEKEKQQQQQQQQKKEEKIEEEKNQKENQEYQKKKQQQNRQKQKQMWGQEIMEQINQEKEEEVLIDEENSDYDEDHPEILKIFHEQDHSDLPKYKDYVEKRELLNVIVGDDYMNSLQNYRSNPQYEKVVIEIVKILRSIETDQVKREILSKIPFHLFKQLTHYDLQDNQVLQQQNNLRQEEKRRPNFNNEVEDEQNMSEQRYDFDEEQESESISDFGDEWGDFGLEDDEDDNLSDDLQDLSVPDFKNILSSIEENIEGDQFTEEQMTKILQVSLLQLFFMSSASLKLKAVHSFYKEILKTKMRKTYIDSFLTLARIDQFFNKQSVHIYKLIEYGISPRRALDNFLQIIVQSYEDQNDDFYKQFVDKRGKVLKTAEKILFSLPERDNILSMLLFYCKIKHPKTHNKIDILLRKFRQFNYSLDKDKAKILATQVYQSENSSSIWRNIENQYSVKIEEKIKFYAMFDVYSSLLKNQLTDTLEIMHDKQLKMSLHNEMKIAQNLLKIHQKKLKHFFFWNRNFSSSFTIDEEKKKIIMKNQKLIELLELMFFYLKDLKTKFFENIEEKTFNKIILLPKNIVQIPFFYLTRMKKSLVNWKNPSQIHMFFQKAKCGETHFSNIMSVSNLLLQFVDIPSFSAISFKNIIIPYFMKKQEGGRELPLVFKTPAIPQQPTGQRLFLTRQCSFDMSFYQVNAKAILVEYNGEEGSDYGGMVREFMMGWQGKGIGEEYFYFGRLLGISFKKSIPYGGEFDLPMAIAITGFVPGLQFVKEHDMKLYTSLNYILDNDVEDLELRFIISKNKYGIVKEYPLKQNGGHLEVTNQNKQEYVDLFLKNVYSCGREWELSEIRAGFYSVVNRKYAQIFHPVDLIHKVRGEEVHDYLKLKKKAKYESGYTPNTPIIKWLWEIISTFDQKALNRFIQFLTGAPKISIYDPHFKVVIQKNYTDDWQKLPVAHTCFNTLDLPEYSTKQILDNKIRTAIFQGNENFGLL